MDIGFLALAASLIAPPAVGGTLLRLGGCRWGRVVFGSAMLFAVAMAVLLVLFAFCRRHGWDFDTIVLALPLIEAAAFAFLFANRRDHGAA